MSAIPYEWAWVGNVVECLNSSGWTNPWPVDGPSLGEEGAIADVWIDAEGNVGIAFNTYGLDNHYNAGYFRPLQSESGELEAAFYYGKNLHAKPSPKVRA